MNITITENLKALRKNANKTQENLAEFLTISINAVSKWERGECYPDIELLPKIAAFYNVTVDDLLGVGEMRKRERVAEILVKYEELKVACTLEADIEKNAIAKGAYQSFPNDWSVIDMYRNSMVCGHIDQETLDGNKSKLRELCQLILDECNVEEYKRNAVMSLLYICEDDEEAETLLAQVHDPSEFIYWPTQLRVDYYIRCGYFDKARKLQQENLVNYFYAMESVMQDLCDSYMGMPYMDEEFRADMNRKRMEIKKMIVGKD